MTTISGTIILILLINLYLNVNQQNQKELINNIVLVILEEKF